MFSFDRSFVTSAKFCKIPNLPTYVGPCLDCILAISFLSAQPKRYTNSTTTIKSIIAKVIEEIIVFTNEIDPYVLGKLVFRPCKYPNSSHNMFTTYI